MWLIIGTHIVSMHFVCVSENFVLQCSTAFSNTSVKEWMNLLNQSGIRPKILSIAAPFKGLTRRNVKAGPSFEKTVKQINNMLPSTY